MADTYTPTTAEVRSDQVRCKCGCGEARPVTPAEFDAWLAAYTTAKRAEWEAEVEWEYGNEMLLNTQTVIHPASSEMLAKVQAWLWPMHRRRKAGPWIGVSDEGH